MLGPLDSPAQINKVPLRFSGSPPHASASLPCQSPLLCLSGLQLSLSDLTRQAPAAQHLLRSSPSRPARPERRLTSRLWLFVPLPHPPHISALRFSLQACTRQVAIASCLSVEASTPVLPPARPRCQSLLRSSPGRPVRPHHSPAPLMCTDDKCEVLSLSVGSRVVVVTCDYCILLYDSECVRLLIIIMFTNVGVLTRQSGTN